MPNNITKEELFLESANSLDGINSIDDFDVWFENYYKNHKYSVELIPLNKLNGWDVDPTSGNIKHSTGKFYSIEGLKVKTSFGKTNYWEQPIINQPEIGILGFLTKTFNGLLHFLVQAKMEPGNVNSLQISPTVQATKSNYTQVHGGLKTRYLEYFLDNHNNNIFLDQLQSEQGSRFYMKRNRNMIINVKESEDIELHESFFWLTLGQILEIVKRDNIINMDSRTVLSGVQYLNIENINNEQITQKEASTFSEELYISSSTFGFGATHNFEKIMSWITTLKTEIETEIRKIPLNQLTSWSNNGNVISNENKTFFSIVGVSVTAGDREVTKWNQPLLNSLDGGVHCFFVSKISGILHFLVQAKSEPGNLDLIELAPTIQCSLANYSSHTNYPHYIDLLDQIPSENIHFDTMQSEEGGRFYHDQNRYVIAEVDSAMVREIKPNYKWMTLGQIKELIRFNNYFNIEARGLLSCLKVTKPL